MEIPILYEDENVLVINKPSGLIVHGDGRGQTLASDQSRDGGSVPTTLADWLIENYPEIKDVGEPMLGARRQELGANIILRPGIVHRLDKETSGIMVIAKNQKTFLFLKEQFKERKVKKVYRAIVWGWIKNDEGIINSPIGRSKKDFRQWSAQRGARGAMREAVTEYKVLKRFSVGAENRKLQVTSYKLQEDKFSYLEIYPLTGRTHQIRVHMKYLNHPVVCDTLYAPKRPCPLVLCPSEASCEGGGMNRLALHAFSIEFQLPVPRKSASSLPAEASAQAGPRESAQAESLRVEAPLSDDFEQALNLIP